MNKKTKRTYKVTLTFARATAISDKQVQDILLDSLLDTFGEICIKNTDYAPPAYVTKIKVTK